MYCESTFEREGELAFDARGWSPIVDTLQDIAANVMVEVGYYKYSLEPNTWYLLIYLFRTTV